MKKRSFTVVASNGAKMELVNYAERILSSVNTKIEWLIDFRPFRIDDTTDVDSDLYKADDQDTFQYHTMDEEFVKNYEPTIIVNEYGKKYCNDVKLPSGRWMEQISVLEETKNKIVFSALIDAYGTYNEQR